VKKRGEIIKKRKHYVNNKDLLVEMINYRETNHITEELGRMIFEIAKNFASKGSYSGYTWKEDMISESVLTCLKYMHNFDPNKQKYPNPFAYFTTIIYHSFLNYIKKQKKHSEIKDICYKKINLLEEDNYGDYYLIKAIDYQILRSLDRVKKKGVIKKEK